MLRLIRRDERGATATIFGLLVAGGVFMAMLALTVDVGNIWLERRHLQNGADAGSMALAAECAVNQPGCEPAAAEGEVDPFLNLNSSMDQESELDVDRYGTGICERGAGAGFADCDPANNGNDVLAKCPPLPSWLTGAGATIPFVEVYSSTETAGTASPRALPEFFTGLLKDGDPGDATVRACARAAWGPVKSTSDTVLAITMSECDWRARTGYTGPNTAAYPPSPVGVPGYDADPSTEQPEWPVSDEEPVFSKGNDTICDTSSPGGTAPGGFAWLEGEADACTATVSDNSWLHGDTGADGCDEADLDKYRGQIVHIPVFDCVADSAGPHPVPNGYDCDSGVGNNAYYHVAGYAAFYLSGWQLTMGTKESIAPGGMAFCSPDRDSSERCLFGWFLKDLVAEGEIKPPGDPNDPDYGVTVVKPAG